MSTDSSTALPGTTERVSAWGMNIHCDAPVLRPESIEDLRAALAQVRDGQASVALRGSGCSYGDASLNSKGAVFDFSAMSSILKFDQAEGVLVAEPGVTIQDVWRTVLPTGWWPPVVPGTMYPTLGGCAAMNIHGKNNFQASTIGHHIQSFDLMLASGEIKTCSRDDNADLFHAAIGGFGMLGVFTKITLKLKRIHSGDLWVRGIARNSIPSLIEYFEAHHETADYLVGWVDAFGGGRGLIHEAWYLKPGEDKEPAKTLLESHQDLPKRLMGIVPKGWMWWGLWCFFHRPGMRLVNAAKYILGRMTSKDESKKHRQSLVGFSFLLDYVPGWKKAYKPGAFIQYQTFVPKETAGAVFETQLRLAREAKIMPFLGVLKKHQPDPFLMTHAVDGYSLALDFPKTKGNSKRLLNLCEAMNQAVIEGGGRWYFAKDSVLDAKAVRQAYPDSNLKQFLELKRQLDPNSVFQTDLARRLEFSPPGAV